MSKLVRRFSSFLYIIATLLYFQCVVHSAGVQVGQPSSASQSISSLIVRQRLTYNATLPCTGLGPASAKEVQWWHRTVGAHWIGSFWPETGIIVMNWTREGAYRVLANGSLLVLNVRRELVERYECLIRLKDGSQLSGPVFLRLDFSFWYAFELYALFFGSWLAALVFCATSFLLNIIWIVLTSTVLWWIKRTERLSRVRSLLEAMEKYRQRQLENLQETYSRRVSAIRDNYHSQMEQIRQSYAESSGRFRDYRQAQLDNVHQHLDHIRDNYCQQINRIREFGSRRVEQIWERYDHSMHAVKTFTLEQRLKIQRQYKVKQRYLNKLLEAISTETNEETIAKKEAAIREVLGEEDSPLWSLPPHSGHSLRTVPRSASYYSLPEFVLEDGHHENADFAEEAKVRKDQTEDQQPSCSSDSTRLTLVKFAEDDKEGFPDKEANRGLREYAGPPTNN